MFNVKSSCNLSEKFREEKEKIEARIKEQLEEQLEEYTNTLNQKINYNTDHIYNSSNKYNKSRCNVNRENFIEKRESLKKRQLDEKDHKKIIEFLCNDNSLKLADDSDNFIYKSFINFYGILKSKGMTSKTRLADYKEITNHYTKKTENNFNSEINLYLGLIIEHDCFESMGLSNKKLKREKNKVKFKALCTAIQTFSKESTQLPTPYFLKKIDEEIKKDKSNNEKDITHKDYFDKTLQFTLKNALKHQTKEDQPTSEIPALLNTKH